MAFWVQVEAGQDDDLGQTLGVLGEETALAAISVRPPGRVHVLGPIASWVIRDLGNDRVPGSLAMKGEINLVGWTEYSLSAQARALMMITLTGCGQSEPVAAMTSPSSSWITCRMRSDTPANAS
jgi:hypothetical protein